MQRTDQYAAAGLDVKFAVRYSTVCAIGAGALALRLDATSKTNQILSKQLNHGGPRAPHEKAEAFWFRGGVRSLG